MLISREQLGAQRPHFHIDKTVEVTEASDRDSSLWRCFRAGLTAEVNLADPETCWKDYSSQLAQKHLSIPPQRSWRMWLELLCTVCCPRKSQTWMSSQL